MRAKRLTQSPHLLRAACVGHAAWGSRLETARISALQRSL